MEGTVKTASDAKSLTADDVCHIFLGCGLEEFIRNALTHPEKYDIWEDTPVCLAKGAD